MARSTRYRMKADHPSPVKFRLRGRNAPAAVHVRAIKTPVISRPRLDEEAMRSILTDYPTLSRSLLRARRRMRLDSACQQKRLTKAVRRG